MDNLSAADLAAIQNRSSDGLFGGSGLSLLVIILFLAFTGNGGLFGGGKSDYATKSDLSEAISNQTTQNEVRNVGTQVANGFNTQNISFLSNMNALQQGISQGFGGLQLGLNTGVNTITSGLCNGFNLVNSNLAGLGNQFAQCCCDMKTTIRDAKDEIETIINGINLANINNTLEDKNRQLLAQEIATSQANQTAILQASLRNIFGNNFCGCSA